MCFEATCAEFLIPRLAYNAVGNPSCGVDYPPVEFDGARVVVEVTGGPPVVPAVVEAVVPPVVGPETLVVAVGPDAVVVAPGAAVVPPLAAVVDGVGGGGG